MIVLARGVVAIDGHGAFFRRVDVVAAFTVSLAAVAVFGAQSVTDGSLPLLWRAGMVKL